MLKMQIKGITEAQLYVDKKKDDVDINVIRGLEQSGRYVQAQVISSIGGEKPEPRSFRTGNFIGHVEMVRAGTTATIYTMVPYSQYLEWGTRYIAPRRHFENTANREQDTVQKIMDEKIHKQ